MNKQIYTWPLFYILSNVKLFHYIESSLFEEREITHLIIYYLSLISMFWIIIFDAFLKPLMKMSITKVEKKMFSFF